MTNIEEYNNLINKKLLLLSSYPICFYNQLWNENSELKKLNDSPPLFLHIYSDTFLTSSTASLGQAEKPTFF